MSSIPTRHVQLGCSAVSASRRTQSRISSSLATLGHNVTASRMVKDYTPELYEPAAAHAARLTDSHMQAARDLAAWKARVLAAWGEGLNRPRLVHRLDRDTSGVLLLGKSPAAAARE